MSDNILIFVPSNPRYVPSSEAQRVATALVRTALPNADEVKAGQSAGIQFHDCGGNLERVSCPHCLAEISREWWGARMDDDYEDGGFSLGPYKLPCCFRTSNLNELRYDWPQAFGRFAISVMNPDIVEVPESLLVALEASLDCEVVTVWQHL